MYCICSYVFILFSSWSYMVNVQASSPNERTNIFSIADHIFCNLFWIIWPLSEQILMTRLQYSRTSFRFFFSCREKIRWGWLFFVIKYTGLAFSFPLSDVKWNFLGRNIPEFPVNAYKHVFVNRWNVREIKDIVICETKTEVYFSMATATWW